MSGSSTYSRALARGRRLNVWNTDPMYRLRMSESWSSSRPDTRRPFSRYSPRVGVSRQPIRFMNVLFPEPDGPMTATYSLRRTVRSTPRSAATVSAPMT